MVILRFPMQILIGKDSYCIGAETESYAPGVVLVGSR